MRTRFAPSPTGYLHIGGLRTALYAYLVARKEQGQFLLRIEDTDREREVAGAVEQILQGLEWAGMPPDEGVVLDNGVVAQRGPHGPYVQSERLEIYKEHAKILLDGGHAYPCFCTAERLEQMRTLQQERKQAPMYDRKCMRLSPEEARARMEAGEKHVLRLKVPHGETISFFDDIRGEVQFQGHTVDDQVLMKSDGFPTYHLAHVVDDKHMRIDVVIRGEEWLSSLPKHLLLFKAFGWAPPRYAHLPLLLNKDRTKLSKRQGAVSVGEYIEKGYLPEAVLNFIALLGWNPGTTQELFTVAELTEAFTLDRVQKAGAVFDEEKLEWIQGQWIRKMTPEDFTERIRPIVAQQFPQAADDADFIHKAALIRERVTFFREAPEMLSYFYAEPTVSVELLANAKQKVTPEQLPEFLDAVTAALDALPADRWTDPNILAECRVLCEQKEYKLGQVLWPLRAALTGLPYSPGATEVAAELGKEKTMARLRKAREIA